MESSGSTPVDITPGLAGTISDDLDWSPDGSHIAFFRNTATTYDLFVVNADGSALLRLHSEPVRPGLQPNVPDWSPDGSKILFDSRMPAGEDGCNFPDLFAINADGSGLTNLTNHSAVHSDGRWSTDGSRIAFVSNHVDYGWCAYPGIDVETHVYVMNADGGDQARLWP